MTDNPYVKQFLADQEQAQSDADAYRQSVMVEGLPLFLANCQVWLGEMWAECQFREPWAKYDERAGGIGFCQPFLWEGIEGAIYSSWWGRRVPVRRSGLTSNSEISSSLVLSSGNRGEYQSFYESFRLPISNAGELSGAAYNDLAQEPNPVRLGEFLVKVLQKKEIWDKHRTEQKEGKQRLRHNTLHNDIAFADDRDELETALQKAKNEFPEDEDYWTGVAEKRKAWMQQREDDQKAAEEHTKAWNQEQERLEQLAAVAFHPFTIYKIRYGAKAVSEDEWGTSFYETEDWSAFSAPDLDGWWLVLRYGDAVRVRISNLLAVEEHQVDTYGDVPGGVLGKTYFESEQFPGLSAEAWDLSPFEAGK